MNEKYQEKGCLGCSMFEACKNAGMALCDIAEDDDL